MERETAGRAAARLLPLLLMACSQVVDPVSDGGGGDSGGASGGSGGRGGDGGGGFGGMDAPPLMPAAGCMPTASGAPAAQAPTLMVTLKDRFHEGWLASPAVADLDRDGKSEIVLARDGRVLVFAADGTLRWQANLPGRAWASPVTADFAGDARLEVVVASRGDVIMYDAAGAVMPGFPVTWRDELRSLAAGDVDGDGRLEIVVATTSLLRAGGQSDVMQVLRADGSVQPGFPPNTTGTSGCTTACYLAGAFDQNIAVGPLDGEGGWDIVVPHDNAYISWHKGSGVAFDAAAIFRNRPKAPGIRFLHDYAEAQMGYSDMEATSNQAHFTNSPPAIADVDGDGDNEIVVLGSVQNAAQTDRLRGVGLWLLNSDGTRPPSWTAPLHVPEYLAGLWDFDGENIVAATNQVAVVELDPAATGLEMVFAGFDGKVHAVGADRQERWTFPYTTASNVLTGGVAIADLSGDGVPEVVLASYSTQAGAGALYVLGAQGALQHRLALPGRGSMAVPTVADVNGDGTLEIVVNLKDGEDRMRSALVYTVPGSAGNCRPWPTGRGNELRNGYVPRR